MLSLSFYWTSLPKRLLGKPPHTLKALRWEGWWSHACNFLHWTGCSRAPAQCFVFSINQSILLLNKCSPLWFSRCERVLKSLSSRPEDWIKTQHLEFPIWKLLPGDQKLVLTGLCPWALEFPCYCLTWKASFCQVVKKVFGKGKSVVENVGIP